MNEANKVKDQAETRSRYCYENKKKDPFFVTPQVGDENNLVLFVQNVNGEEVIDVAAMRRRGK
jgi:hypothetical protein